MSEQRYPVLKTIFSISPQVEMVKDPVVLFAFQKLFEWANNEGLAGRAVEGLEFVLPRVVDPFSEHIKARCLVWMNEEELRQSEGNMRAQGIIDRENLNPT